MTSSACTTAPSSAAFSASSTLSRSATSPTRTLRRYFGHHTRWNLSEKTAPALRFRGGTHALYVYRASNVVHNAGGSLARGSDTFGVAGIPLPAQAGSPLPSTLMEMPPRLLECATTY